MKIGVVLPHNEIGTDPQAIKDFAIGAEQLGADHMLIYDHVLGADPDRPGGFRGPYDKDVAFHEPFTVFAFIAAITTKIDMVTTVLISPQRQTVLIAKQAAELALLSGNRFRMGIGTGWNDIEYEALNEDFTNRGRRQAEQVDLMRKLWSSDSLDYEGKYHTVSKASINPRPTRPIPIWFGGGAPIVLKRCARLGDGWMPLMGANDAAREALDFIKSERQRLGLETEGFGVQAQAQYAGGNPDRWKNHHDKWQALGATHLAIATHNAGETNVDGHLNRISDYMHAVGAS